MTILRARLPLLAALGLLSGLAACSRPETASEPAPETVEARAVRLAHELLIVDTHVDVPYRLEREMAVIGERTEGGDFDHPRAKEGGLDAPFMSIYVPA
ncbi:MAG: membrane dipeptidase, partial [Thermoanaerobaculia bacterium]|nr:membrane dipeptidase [Thermoanaerobaculia bacterium]